MSGHTVIGEADAKASLDALLDRVETTLSETDVEFPLVADPDTGEWETTVDGNWCAGHWISLLHLAQYYASSADKRERYETAATEHLAVLTDADDLKYSMFGGMNHLYAGFRGYDLTGDRSLFGLGLEGADAMVELFSENAQIIPRREHSYAISGPEYETKRDSIENEAGLSTKVECSSDSIYTTLPVLWRAYEETADPTFRDIAISHANRHLKWHIREDGRTWNRTILNPETGEPTEHYNKHAHSDDTCWARGHGWIIAGYCSAYSHTGAERYLEAIERTVEYYREQSPEDLVPYWDFEDPAIPDAPRDTSAAGLVAYGLARLAGEDARVEELRNTGLKILNSIIEKYLVTQNGRRRGMILHGCYEMPSGYAIDNELIWTNYYVAYTLHMLLQR